MTMRLYFSFNMLLIITVFATSFEQEASMIADDRQEKTFYAKYFTTKNRLRVVPIINDAIIITTSDYDSQKMLDSLAKSANNLVKQEFSCLNASFFNDRSSSISNHHTNNQVIEHVELDDNYIECVRFDSFVDLTSLVSIKLETNLLTELEPFTFSNLSLLLTISLKENKLKRIKAKTFYNLSSITDIDLSANDIEYLEENSFQMVDSLNVIRLTDNKLKLLKSFTFDPIQKVTMLILNLNQLDELESNALANLNHLTTLEMYHNSRSLKNPFFVSTVEYIAISGCNSLQQLINVYNQIDATKVTTTKIYSVEFVLNNVGRFNFLNMLNKLSKLTFVRLKSNSIDSIEPFAFANSSTLFSIETKSNNVRVIRARAFYNLTTLKDVYFGYNGLEIIESYAFVECPSLSDLNLEYNSLKVIYSFTFFDLSQLHKISFAFNSIHTIEQDAFHKLESIKTIVLNGNCIRYIHMRAFQFVTNSLERVMMEDNFCKINDQFIFSNSNYLLAGGFSKHNMYQVTSAFLNRSFQTFELFSSDLSLVEFNIEAAKAKNIWIVNLLSSNIDTLEKSSPLFSLPSLKYLHIICSQVNLIKRDAFVNLKSLDTIFIKRSRIKEIESYAFNNIRSLSKLQLVDNEIEKLPEYAFTNMPGISEINIESGRIPVISKHAFSKLTGLLTLNIMSAQLETIESYAFNKLDALSRINLRRNAIKYIRSFTYSDLMGLKYVNYHTNFLRSIESKAFNNLPELSIIDLSLNPIELIEWQAFYNVPSLGSIKIEKSYVKISHPFLFHSPNYLLLFGWQINESPVSSLLKVHFKNNNFSSSLNISKVKMFDLYNCDIELLAFDFVRDFKSLTNLKLNGNLIRNVRSFLLLLDQQQQQQQQQQSNLNISSTQTPQFEVTYNFNTFSSIESAALKFESPDISSSTSSSTSSSKIKLIKLVNNFFNIFHSSSELKNLRRFFHQIVIASNFISFDSDKLNANAKIDYLKYQLDFERLILLKNTSFFVKTILNVDYYLSVLVL